MKRESLSIMVSYINVGVDQTDTWFRTLNEQLVVRFTITGHKIRKHAL